MSDTRMELLIAIYAVGADQDQTTSAALARGAELGLTDEEVYVLLERLHDDRLIERNEPARSGDGKISFYRITRVTQAGVQAIDQYRPKD